MTCFHLEIECGLNMEYLYCSYPGETRTCYDEMSPVPLQDVVDMCREGCFCMENYVMDLSGEACVPKQSCGCFYKDRYYSVSLYNDEFPFCIRNIMCLINMCCVCTLHVLTITFSR